MNKKVVLQSRPEELVKLSDFKTISEPIQTSLKLGEVLVRVEWISIDPAQRVWISGVRSYIPAIAIGQVIRAMGVGIVLASRSPIIKRGEFVSGYFGWQEFSVISGSELIKLPSYENPQFYLGVLGISGLTAYFSVFQVAKAQPSDIMIVSTAAGSVGSLVCQLGKMIGCKVFGIVGSDEKGSYLTKELGVDGYVNYKNEKNLAQAIRKMCPTGVDVFVDHVGGNVLDAVLANIKKNARIVLSGAISSYSQRRAPPIFNYAAGISKSAEIQGFIVWDYVEMFQDAQEKLLAWIKEKKLRHREQVLEGVENAPNALRMIMNGENYGKMIVRVLHEAPKL